MDASTTLLYLLLGGVLGAVGQGLRVIVGLKKKYDEVLQSKASMKDEFDASKLIVSLLIAFVIGAIAGVLGVIKYLGQDITQEFIITIMGIGYAGTDFIEGFIYKNTPNEAKKIKPA